MRSILPIKHQLTSLQSVRHVTYFAIIHTHIVEQQSIDVHRTFLLNFNIFFIQPTTPNVALMKPVNQRGFGTKAVLGANFVSTSPIAHSPKLPLSSRTLDSVPLALISNSRSSGGSLQVPQLKTFTDAGQGIDISDAIPWYNGETAHDYTMHLLALSGSDSVTNDCDIEAGKRNGSKFSKVKSALLVTSFLNANSKNPNVKVENSKAVAAFKTLSALSDEDKQMYPSWMTEGDIETRKFLAKKIVGNRNRMKALMIRADETLGTDDIREALAKKYGLSEATYTDVADMIANNRAKVKSVLDDINAVSQEQQAVLQEVQRALASTNTDLNFEISNLEDRLDDLQEDSLLQDAERSLGHAKSMRIKLSMSHSRFLDQAVERLTTKMPQVIKTKHMEQDLVLAADSLETMRKSVHEFKANTLKAQKEAQEKSEALKLCQKELSEVSKDRDRLVKIEKEQRASADTWREKFYQCDRDLAFEVHRGEEAERQHKAILDITLKNAQKVVEDQIAATARQHEDHIRKLNSLLFQLEQDLMYEKRLRDPDAVLKNAENLATQSSMPKSSSIIQQLEDLESEKGALERSVERLIKEVNIVSNEKESLQEEITAIALKFQAGEVKTQSLTSEHVAKVSEMQNLINALTLQIEESNSNVIIFRSERDDLQNILSEAQRENFKLNSHIADIVSKKPIPPGIHSVGIQTCPNVDLPQKCNLHPEIAQKSTENAPDVAETVPIEKLTYLNDLKPVPHKTVVVKVMCGTQTDAPYPRISDDSARFAISCTRPECLAKIEEIHKLKELSITNAKSEALEASSKLNNQLAIRDREHKAASLKLKKEFDIKLAFEREGLTKAQKQLEQFKSAVKKKSESIIMEIKKMKRIGDFSNVGEVELHLNDIYIGATESFDSLQAEIDARIQEETRLSSQEIISTGDLQLAEDAMQSPNNAIQSSSASSKFCAVSKAVMFSKSFFKGMGSSGGSSRSTDSDHVKQSCSIEELQLTAASFHASSEQFLSGCSFGINSSSVSLERAQKKLTVCVEHFREQKKAAADSIFQLNLELKDFKQKFEDSQMVIATQAVALVRAQRDRSNLAKRLSKHEECDEFDCEIPDPANVSHASIPQKNPSMSASAIASKMGRASKAILFTKTLGNRSDNKNYFDKSDLQGVSKNVQDSRPAGPLASAAKMPSKDDKEELGNSQIDAIVSNDSNDNIVQGESSHESLNSFISNSQSNDEADGGNSRFVDVPRNFENHLFEHRNASFLNDTAAINSNEISKTKGFRRIFDELKLPIISCIYQESITLPPVLDFATQVELSSLRSLQKSNDAKIRKLEQMLEDKENQLQHSTILMDSSIREQARCRSHAMDLSLEVHSERSKLEVQLEWNAKLALKVSSLEEKLKHERQTLNALRIQESAHVQKLQDLTNRMQSFHQRCENYVEEERAPFLAIYLEFWLRLGLFRKDIFNLFALSSIDACKSCCPDLSNYSSLESALLLESFTNSLTKNSLQHLRDEIIRKFQSCCSDIAAAINANRSSPKPGTVEKNEAKLACSTDQPAIPIANTVLPKIFKHDSTSAVAAIVTHKQLLPSLAPKTKQQTFESECIDHAMGRKSVDIVDKLTSKLLKNKFSDDEEVNQKRLASWTKFSPTSTGCLHPEIMNRTKLSLPLNSAGLMKPQVLFSIQEET